MGEQPHHNQAQRRDKMWRPQMKSITDSKFDKYSAHQEMCVRCGYVYL